MTESQLQHWESRVEWPLAACAVAFLVLYSVQVLGEPQGPAGQAVSVALDLLYVPFVIDYLVRLKLAENRWQWFIRHPLDLAVVTLPFLQPLRFLRLVALARILERALGDAVRGRLIAFTTFAAILLVYTSALAELHHERYAPGGQINTLSDSLWWAVTTLSTVGYGDHVPITNTGRIIAVLLMIGGICLIGVVTATVAHWIISEVGKQDSAQQAATVAHVEELREEIRTLQKLVHQEKLVHQQAGSEGDANPGRASLTRSRTSPAPTGTSPPSAAPPSAAPPSAAPVTPVPGVPSGTR
ncbi:MAG: ion channel [Mycobacterium sp.]